MKKPRHLSPDERDLWDKVASRTTRLRPSQAETSLPDAPPKPLKMETDKAKTAISSFRAGSKATHKADHDLMSSLSEQLAKSPVRMDAKAHGRMKRGKMKPEARIDLHGMTMAEAHPALTSFILSSYSMGRRLVLVITGKGKNTDEGGPIPARFGKLRHQVPQWLRQQPLAGVVLQVSEAHQSHGGSGALYVYLRRSR